MVPSKEDLAQLTPDELLERVVALQNENFQLREILDKVPCDVYWKNTDGIWQGVNQTGLDTLRDMGYAHHTSEGVIGKSDAEMFGHEIGDLYRKNDLKVMQELAELSAEETINLPSGQTVTKLSSKRPLLSPEGKLLGIIGSSMDITHIKDIEKELIESKEAAELANEAKSEFLRNMEHDIRTPFNGIQGIAEYLYESETDDERKSALGDVKRASKELLDFCNSIADLAKIEAGMLTLTDQKFNLHDLITSLISLERPAAVHRGLQLIARMPDDLPAIVVGDRYRLYRILVNLLSNAIKFTPEGKVHLIVSIVEQQDRNILLRFNVQDTGVGVPEDKKEYIFERFSRLSVSYSNTQKGIGLGLRIVKQFMNEMDGEIDIITSPNEGTQFICTLPMTLPLTEDFV